jgi:hypothetical protein
MLIVQVFNNALAAYLDVVEIDMPLLAPAAPPLDLHALLIQVGLGYLKYRWMDRWRKTHTMARQRGVDDALQGALGTA